MFAIKDDVFIGFSSGRIILIPSSNILSLPIKYLTEASSILLCSILQIDEGSSLVREIFSSLSIDEINIQSQKLLDELKPFLVEDKKEKRITFQKLEHSRLNKTVDSSYFRLDYPVRIAVVPTWKCNRNCAYCGVPKIKPNCQEAQIDPELLLSRLLDAVDCGVQSVVYHGGEPIFWYDDIFKHIRKLRDKNVYIQISTKNYISTDIAYKLADSGLEKIQLSIDTIDPVLCKQLYGDELYPQKLAKSVQHLTKIGIDTRVNIVLSKYNYKGISDLLKYLYSLGVSEVEISNYKCGSINETSLEISKEERAWLYRSYLKNQSNWNFKYLIFSPYGEKILPAVQRPICESGRLGMVFLPDGRGCYCDFLCEKPEFCVGNLNDNSIGEIWNDPKLINMTYPSKEVFNNDSKCYSCNEFNICVTRGFCFVKTGGKYISDQKCTECLSLGGQKC